MANRLSMVSGLQAGKNCQEFLVQLHMIQASGLALGNDTNIHGPTDLIMVMSEKLSYPAFESIPADRIADLATHRYPQSGVHPAGADDDNEVACVIPYTFPPVFLVFARSTNPAKPGKGLLIIHPVVRLLARNCCRQTLAAPGTPTPDYVRSRFATHPLAKTVRTLATNPTWLKCSLHLYLLLFYNR